MSRLHSTIIDDLRTRFEDVIRDSSFIGGPWVERFEAQLSAYCDTTHCVGTANGTDAIELALEALRLEAGDEVIVPAMGFAATAEAVVRQGGRPVFADVDPVTLNLSVRTLEAAVKRASAHKLKAIIAVHLYGQACDMNGLVAAAVRLGLPIIEDCAQAHGCRINGRHVGTFGDVGTFSFFPGKNLGALGDGGAIITKSEHIAGHIRMARDHGRTSKYEHRFIGRNSRLDGLQAAFLSVKLEHLDRWNHSRELLARMYTDLLKDVPGLQLPQKPAHGGHVFHNYVVRFEGSRYSRDRVQAALSARGIQAGIHYPKGIHELEAFSQFRPTAPLTVTEAAAREVLSLPIDPMMSASDVIVVCEALIDVLRQMRGSAKGASRSPLALLSGKSPVDVTSAL